MSLRQDHIIIYFYNVVVLYIVLEYLSKEKCVLQFAFDIFKWAFPTFFNKGRRIAEQEIYMAVAKVRTYTLSDLGVRLYIDIIISDMFVTDMFVHARKGILNNE